MSLIQRLQQALDKLDPNPPPPPQEEIPKFYRKDYYDESILPLRKAVYQHKNARRQEYIATSQELEETWELFKMYHDSIINATSKDPKYYISYKKFKIVREKVLPKLRPYFTAKHFLGFKQTDKKLISASDFMEFIFKTNLLMEGYDSLSDYGQTYDGFVTEDELQLYIEDLIPSLCLRPQSAQFRKFYLCNCVKKFTFFLDKNRNGRMKIMNIVLSPIFVELMELKDLSLSQELQDNNWFSTSVSMRVYGEFIRLDTDKNGMLSRKELARYRNGNLTRAFLDRLFAEMQTYGGEMDYMGYLDFVLAIENLDTPEAMAIIFPILDVKKDGFLDESTISYFVKDVVIRMFAANLDAIPKSDVVNEIFDMVNPKVKHYITLKDLQTCGVGGAVLDILTDFTGFHSYDNRPQGEA
ncbi:Serine/threonine-protein phosphatase 2A regulatory subunit B'' subunit gamma [Boothiomyces sp. JEL0838]|nr:Serine/threonine-protein phosphatase 2A regulatory subunit B'' subunit gamma [Boothiomyces sp. JEL0838]KAJ3314605.1 Serine/threonine-protein phosphatase 2A regulatory subunit B'' subunit gamma [Boothiomyces sp. JEL0838]